MNLRIAGESDMEPRGGFVRHSNTPLRKYRLADLDRRSCWRSFRSDCSLRSSSAMRRQCRTAKLDDFRAFQKVVWRRASHVSTSVPVFALITVPPAREYRSDNSELMTCHQVVADRNALSDRSEGTSFFEQKPDHLRGRACSQQAN